MFNVHIQGVKELPVIPVNKVVDPKKNNRTKMEGQEGGEAQGVADPQKDLIICYSSPFPRTTGLFHACLCYISDAPLRGCSN
jgi:hypothetical protein